MLQADRTWLFNKAYELDNKSRLWIPKSAHLQFRIIAGDYLDRLRIQERTDCLYTVFSEAELSTLTEEMRTIAANDEARMLR